MTYTETVQISNTHDEFEYILSVGQTDNLK